jgi:hypothetical protein
MSTIEIDYDSLTPVGYSHVSKLVNQEGAIRRAIAGIGRSCGVRWLSKGPPSRLALRLVAYGDPTDCIAEFQLSDFDLDADSFAQLILANQRPCTSDVWDDDEEL